MRGQEANEPFDEHGERRVSHPHEGSGEPVRREGSGSDAASAIPMRGQEALVNSTA